MWIGINIPDDKYEWIKNHKGLTTYLTTEMLYKRVREGIPFRPTGHWIRITNGAMKEKYICSECRRQIEDDGIEGLLYIKYPYCHCGAKMEEQE